MSYFKVEMISAKCDNCGENYFEDHKGWSCFTDENACWEEMDNDGWHEADDHKHYCPNCHTVDDEENLTIKPVNP